MIEIKVYMVNCVEKCAVLYICQSITSIKINVLYLSRPSYMVLITQPKWGNGLTNFNLMFNALLLHEFIIHIHVNLLCNHFGYSLYWQNGSL